MDFSTISSWARMIWDGLNIHGVDADSLFKEVGLEPRLLSDSDARYPTKKMFKLWSLAVDRTGDPCFGLTVGTQWHPTTWHALGYAWFASATLEEAFKRLTRYSAMITTAGEFLLEERSADFKFAVLPHFHEAHLPAAVMDALMTNLITMCRVSYGDDFNPLRVSFSHSGDGCRRRRREFFTSPIEYGAEENRVLFDKERLRKSLVTANAELAHSSDRVIAEYLARIGIGTTTSTVQAILVDLLPSGEVTEESLAASLNVSQSTLRRRLKKEGTTYRAVLQEVRCTLAGKMLEDGSKTLNEISFLLGFAELSAFSRAFKRWTGAAPSEYRESART
jgi:AraC-like DNA-binding protein